MTHAKSMWFIYIVECNDGTLYTGATNDIDNRIKKHNSGNGAYYTSLRAPVHLRYFEQFETKSEALSREHAIKRIKSADKWELIKSLDYLKEFKFE